MRPEWALDAKPAGRRMPVIQVTDSPEKTTPAMLFFVSSFRNLDVRLQRMTSLRPTKARRQIFPVVRHHPESSTEERLLQRLSCRQYRSLAGTALRWRL